MSDPKQCQYIGDSGIGLDREVIENGAVRCTADAQVIVRLKSPLMSGKNLMNAMKTPVCARHGEWLQESDDVARDWKSVGQ